MDKVLKDFLADMEKLQETPDTEKAHVEADELLTELVYFLGKRAGYRLEVREIIEAYQNIDKWYA